MWKTPRTALVAGAALIAGLGVGAAVVPAMAAQEPVLTEEQQTQLQSELDAYRACLESQGVTPPERPADGSRPEPTEEQREARRAAHEACADQRPDRPVLTDEQKATLQAQMEEHRACMEQQLSAAGITKPDRPAPSADGTRPQRPELTDEQKAAIEAARTACEDTRPNLGVEGPGPMGRGFGPGHGPGRPGDPSGPGGLGSPGGGRGPAGASGGSGSSTTT